MEHALTWVEISRQHLTNNIKTFKKLAGTKCVLCPTVKANAYGHGLKECAPIMVAAGADWLGVNALFEAIALREAGIKVPIYIMGYVALEELERVVEQGFQLVVYNRQTLTRLSKICKKSGKPAFTHLKLETGTNRQGVLKKDLAAMLKFYKHEPLLRLTGVATHFANIEDTTDHSYARHQLKNFKEMIGIIEVAGPQPIYKHCANTAATVLFPETHFNLIRTGIGNYGLWPSAETNIVANGQNKKFALQPVMTWKTRVAQIKDVGAGALIGYGCTYKARQKMRLATLPVGYYDGYDRKLSNIAHVLIHGKPAAVRGRVFMNMIVVDVTKIPEVKLEDEAVLLGRQGDQELSAEQLAEWCGTISWEMITRINERIMRKVV